MIVSMNVSHFVKICQVLTILHQLISRGVANFGTRCIMQPPEQVKPGWADSNPLTDTTVITLPKTVQLTKHIREYF